MASGCNTTSPELLAGKRIVQENASGGVRVACSVIVPVTVTLFCLVSTPAVVRSPVTVAPERSVTGATLVTLPVFAAAPILVLASPAFDTAAKLPSGRLTQLRSFT